MPHHTRAFLAPCLAALALSATAGLSHAAGPLPVMKRPPGVQAPLNSAGEGRRLYLALNCSGCHGGAAEGAMGPPIAGKSRFEVRSAVLNGRDEGMRSFRAYVDDTDITNLTNYLNSIGTPNEPVFNDWWIPIPPK